MSSIPVTVVEIDPFPARAKKVWSDDERNEFIDFIARNPVAGDEIPRTGGIRKVRWSRKGIGKRGGIRVVYFFSDENVPVFLLTVYAKSREEGLTPSQKRAAVKLAKALKVQYRRKTK